MKIVVAVEGVVPKSVETAIVAELYSAAADVITRTLMDYPFGEGEYIKMTAGPRPMIDAALERWGHD